MHQDRVEKLLILKNGGIQGLREGKHDVKIAHRQKFGHLSFNPVFLNRVLAFGTMPVTTGVVRNIHETTLCADFGRVAEE